MEEKLKEVGLNDIPEEKKNIQGLYQYGLSDNTLDARISLRNLKLALSNKYCYGTATTGQSFTTWTKINIDTFISNDGLMPDTTNKRINITRSGIYLLEGNVDCKNSGVFQVGVAIRVNGVDATNFFLEMQNSGYATVTRIIPPCVTSVSLKIGDYVELYAYSSSNTSGVSPQSTYLKVTQII